MRSRSQEAPQNDQHVLQGAMRLLAERVLPFVNERCRHLEVHHLLGEEAAEPLARRIESGLVVQPADELQ